MTIHYNLDRFGFDNGAVGHLINGDFPDNEDERWNIIDAPRYSIEKLLSKHVQAQNLLRQCRDRQQPYVLFLRSFSADANVRDGQFSGRFITPHSQALLDSLAFFLEERSVPIIRLFGGSDALFSEISFPGAPETGILSTHADNWLAVVSELISTAAVIVFLVSHLSEGIRLELEQVRSRECQDRCLIVLIDPQKTASRGDVGAGIEELQQTFHDFTNVFELEPPHGSPRLSITSKEFRSCLEKSLQYASASAELDQSVKADFSYLEPDYFLSDDYANSERFLWKELRRLKALFHNTYWAALKERDISYRDLRFDWEWLPAHRAYGLAIATADFAAIQTALIPLELLYMVRGSLFAFNIRALRDKYKELGDKCMPSGIRDTESQYTDDSDPLMLPASEDTALHLFEYAEKAEKNKNFDVANYVYQVAVNIILACDDRNRMESKWMLSRMTHDWAHFQAGTNLARWAVVNYEFSLSISRELSETNPERFLPEAALCLNNLGTVRYQLGDLEASEAAFQEAVNIRRRRPVISERYHENLGHSLMNLGIVVAARNSPEEARKHYEESISVTAERLRKESPAIIDLAHRQILLAHCLATIPGAEQDAKDAVEAAAKSLLKVAAINPEAARQFEAALKQGQDSA